MAVPPPGTPPYRFSPARRANLTDCWAAALEQIVAFMAAGGKFAIPSTNAYRGQYPAFYARQRGALAQHGGIEFVERFCEDRVGWACPTHRTAAECCLDQLLTMQELAGLGVPLMVTIGVDPAGNLSASAGRSGVAGAIGAEVDADPFQLGCFLIAAEQWSYVGVETDGWLGPTSFPLVPAYRRRLGAPKGRAKTLDNEAGVFTRTFEYLELAINVSNRSAVFNWL